MAVKPIPDGYHTITPYLIVNNASKLIDFLKQAFQAEEHFRMTLPNDTLIKHAEVKIGDSIVMISRPLEKRMGRLILLGLDYGDLILLKRASSGRLCWEKR